MHFIRKMMNNSKYQKLFNRCKNVLEIKFILLYQSDILRTEHAQMRYFKNFFWAKSKTRKTTSCPESDRYPPWVQTKIRATKYWCKLLKKCY